MNIKKLTVFSGVDKTGDAERFKKFEIFPGNTAAIVGPTGSGKTSLVTDIEMLAQRDTVTRRKILINDKLPPFSYRQDPSKNPIVLITQHTNFLADLRVDEFLRLHALSRKMKSRGAVPKTLMLANKLTGEKVTENMKMTVLSGGQTRALMIADSIIIGNAPIVLLDEIENAGIFKKEAMAMVKEEGKIILFVTHDPVVALLCDIRLVMKNGGIAKILRTNEREKKARKRIIEQDIMISVIRERVRRGEIIKF